MSSPSQSASPPDPRGRWRLPTLLVLGVSVVVLALAWTVLALVFDRELSGFALVVAALLASTLRYWKAPERASRPWVAAIALAVCVLLARWWIAAGFLGTSLGLYPQESVQRMGLWFATYLNLHALGAVDYCLFASALLLAAYLARPRV